MTNVEAAVNAGVPAVVRDKGRVDVVRQARWFSMGIINVEGRYQTRFLLVDVLERVAVMVVDGRG